MLPSSLALVCLLIGTFWLWLKLRFSYWRRKGIKEWEASSVFGHFWNVIALKGNDVDVADECYKKLGNSKFGGYYFLWKPLLMVKDTDLIKKIMVKDFEHFTDHPAFLDVKLSTDEVLRSLFFFEGAEWKPKRAAFTHFFTPKRLKILHGSVEQFCTKLFSRFDRLAETKEDFTIETSMAEITINVITRTFIGVDMKDQSSFRNAVQRFTEPGLSNIFKSIMYIVHPEINKTLRLTTLDRQIHPIFSELVENVITQRLEQNIVANDLFDYLIRCKNGEIKQFEGITDGELIGHVFSFFTAGHETTALTATFAFYELSKNKEVQDKLWYEISKAAKESKEGLDYEAVKNIPYLTNVIQETMRMYPILGVLKRVCTKPYKLENFDVPLGMEVIVPVRSLHYDPLYFEEPHKFKPERFADGKPPEIYMPFGKGPRICIGMRFAEIVLKISIARIILEYEILPSNKNKEPFEYLPSNIITTRPVGGIWVKIAKRSQE